MRVSNEQKGGDSKVWKDVNYKNFGDIYEINECGIVRSKARTVTRSDGVVQKRKQRELSWNSNTDGYPTVKLSANGASERIAVHRLVALTFLDNNFLLSEVNHKDLNRWNPSVENLEWVSHKDNVSYSCGLGRYGKPQFIGSSNPNAKRVVCVDTGKLYGCIKDAANELIESGLTSGSIQNATSQIIKVCNGSINHYLGFHYQYV